MNNYIENDRLYDDIRPYRDSEVEDVLRDLHQRPDFEKSLGILMWPFISFYNDEEKKDILINISRIIKKIKTIEEFQGEIVLKYMLQPVIDNTMDSFTNSGFEKLSKDRGYLFIGNHRDIILDPALLNYYLFNKKIGTSEVAFGDNLLVNHFITKMLKLNRSFIVKRNLPLVKQLEASTHLSRYIFNTITHEKSVWIAQRGGRAKDGNDVTNPAVISMLYLSQRGEMSLPEFMKKLSVIPVTVSYEYDPCDRLKALEILEMNNSEGGKKSPADDIISMNRGIMGYKGRVHYSAAEPLEITGTTEKEIAQGIDRSIQSSYHLWPSNYIAFDRLNGTANYRCFYTAEDEEKFDERIKRLSPEIKAVIINGYANPVKNFEKVNR
jgi:hypothetical protein